MHAEVMTEGIEERQGAQPESDARRNGKRTSAKANCFQRSIRALNALFGSVPEKNVTWSLKAWDNGRTLLRELNSIRPTKLYSL
jgi:hypothetical protein